jgi:hypothetical protein
MLEVIDTRTRAVVGVAEVVPVDQNRNFRRSSELFGAVGRGEHLKWDLEGTPTR